MLNRQEFYGSEEFKNFISRHKESDMNFIPDEDGIVSSESAPYINYDESYNKPFISFSETVADKPHQYFLEILEKDNDDFLKFLCCRSIGLQLQYYQIVSELVIFTVLRYHEDKVDPFIGSYWKGASKLGMGIAHLKYEYANAFPKKGKSKKKQ